MINLEKAPCHEEMMCTALTTDDVFEAFRKEHKKMSYADTMREFAFVLDTIDDIIESDLEEGNGYDYEYLENAFVSMTALEPDYLQPLLFAKC